MANATEDILDFYRSSDAVEIAANVRSGEVSAAEMFEASVTMIDRLNPRLNAVIHKLYDTGRSMSRSVDRDAPFAFVPFLLKELASSWKGAPMTNSSRYLKDVVASEDSEMTRRIKASGLMLVGKSNAPENGWCISTEPALYGATVNPWDDTVTAGGSSGGSAVAVATGMVPIAEASDGAGSIRVPASCNGLVGLKPSRGRITLAPFVDFWSGAATFLCCSRSVRDTATYLDAVAGPLPGEPYPVPNMEKSFAELARQAPKNLRIGYCTNSTWGDPIHPEIKAAIETTAATLSGLGHHVEEKSMRHDVVGLWKTYTDMTCVETAAGFNAMQALTGHPVTRDEVEPVTWAIIERGRATMATDHAVRVDTLRRAARDIVQDLLPWDVIITPTLTQPPRPVGFYDMQMDDLDSYNALWTDAEFAFPFNISGQPAISLPLGQTSAGLPIGIQFVGRLTEEATLLSLATQLEQAMPWQDRRPDIKI